MKLPDKLTWDRAAEGHSLIPFEIIKLRSGLVKGCWYRPLYESEYLAFFYCPLCGQRLGLLKNLWTVSRRGLVWPTIEYLEEIAAKKSAPTVLYDISLKCNYPNCTFMGIIQLVGWQPLS